MCGIAGFLWLSGGSDVLENNILRMNAAIMHRGPDSGGYWLDEARGLALGHRRLAIQDLSEHGAQPMHSISSRYCMVFNGEIYNFQEIADELRSKYEIMFSGHSDTEVMLAAIETWGLEKALHKFNGMFAFCLWDKESSTMTLCRDRVGEKPLYYGVINGVFYFASELKALEAVLPRSLLNIDTDAIAEFLHYGYVPSPLSIYKETKKLPPASMLTIAADNAGTFEVDPVVYWNLHDVAINGMSNPFHEEAEALTSLEDVLTRNIKRQLAADVDVGLFLSGGIDSSLVTALAQKESTDKIKTYTIGYDEAEYNEAGFAQNVAEYIGSEHLTMQVASKDALGLAPDIATIYDEPFADSSQIPTYLVSKLARRHVTVCLSGDGGDELFCGYNRYTSTAALWGKIDFLPHAVRKMIGSLLAMPSVKSWDAIYALLAASKGSKNRQRLVGLKLQKLANVIQQGDIYQAYEYLLSFCENPDYFLKGYNSTLGNKNDPLVKFGNDYGFINYAMLRDQYGYLPGDNLTKVDRASMALALETRLPLLNYEMVELAWKIPVSMKISQGENKSILRKLLYKHIPRELIDRPKMGFSVPIADWLRGELKEWGEDLLLSLESNYGHILEVKPIMGLWRKHQNKQMDNAHKLWSVLMLLSWLNARA